MGYITEALKVRRDGYQSTRLFAIGDVTDLAIGQGTFVVLVAE